MKRISAIYILSLSLCGSMAAVPAHAIEILSDPFDTQRNLPKKAEGVCEKAEDVSNINLVQAIDIALCRNPDTKIAWANAKTAAADLGQSESDYLPTITLDGVIQKNYSNLKNTGNNANRANGNYTSYGPELNLSYLLFDFGGREANVASYHHSMLASGWDYNSTMQALVFQVIKNYLDVFSSAESVEAAKKAESASKEALDAARARLEVGVVTPADTAQAETTYAQNILARQEAQNNLKLAQGNFATLLHLPPTQNLQYEPVKVSADDAELNKNVDVLISKALKDRPDLLANREREKQAKAQLNVARANGYPSLSLGTTTDNTSYNNSQFTTARESTISLRLSIPLFTGFKNTYEIESAKSTLEATSAQREKGEDNVALDVYTAYNNYQSAKETYISTESLLKSANAAEELALGRYKVGTGTLTDALDAQARLADAEKQWVQSRYNILITRYDLTRALGNVPKIEDQTKPQVKSEDFIGPRQPTSEKIIEKTPPAPPPEPELVTLPVPKTQDPNFVGPIQQ